MAQITAVSVDPKAIGMTIKVKFPRGFRVRLWATTALLRLVEMVCPLDAQATVELE